MSVTRCASSTRSPSATRVTYDSLLRRLGQRPVGDWTCARTVSEVRGGPCTVHPGWAGTADLLQSLWRGREPVEPDTPEVPARYPGSEQSIAVLCAESPDPRSPGRYPAPERRAVADAVALGSWWVWANEPCTAWPARAAAAYTGPWNRVTAHPVLVVDPAYDPSTPCTAGQATARQLGDAWRGVRRTCRRSPTRRGVGVVPGQCGRRGTDDPEWQVLIALAATRA